MPTAAPVAVRFAEHELQIPSPQLGELREANHLLDDVAALRARFAEDGYLFIRELHERDHVLEARRQLLERIATQGRIDHTRPLMDAVIPANAGGAFFGAMKDDAVKTAPAFQSLVRAPRLMRFYDHFFNEPSMAYDFEWLRLVGNGKGTPAHYDVVYMGRGSQNVLTMWTPLGDLNYDQGPLALAVGSHTSPAFAKVRATYGKMDVDRDRVAGGHFSADPLEVAQRYDARWATSEFRAGDALIFGLYTLHASLAHTSDRYRLSCDTRYQPASHPADERWVGETPKGHYGWNAGPQVSIEEKRREWGV